MRFLVSIPMIVLILMVGAFAAPDSESPGERVVFDFTLGHPLEGWQIVNDGVMGGRSRSEFVLSADSTALFRGVLSLANYGGFASVRSPVGEYGLGSFDGIRLRLRGDGRTYDLRLRTDTAFDGIAYRRSLDPPEGVWVTIKVPFREFEPTFRGRTVPNAPPLRPEDIRRLGVLIGDKRESPFLLQIAWMAAYSEE